MILTLSTNVTLTLRGSSNHPAKPSDGSAPNDLTVTGFLALYRTLKKTPELHLAVFQILLFMILLMLFKICNKGFLVDALEHFVLLSLSSLSELACGSNFSCTSNVSLGV